MGSPKGLIASMPQSSALPALSWACSLLSPLPSLLAQPSSGLGAGLWPQALLPNPVKTTEAQPSLGTNTLVPGPEPVLRGAEEEGFSCSSCPKKAVHLRAASPLPVLGLHGWKVMPDRKVFLPRAK